MSNKDAQTRWQAAMMNNYGVPQLKLVRGEGAVVWDADGRRYLDLTTGIAVNALGHAHPAVVSAVTRQIATIGHTSNLYINEPSLTLAERLLDLSGLSGGKVLFCNSGAEALETAKCFEEGVVTSAAHANIGSIFGIGFPPATGGAAQFITGYDAADGRYGIEAFLERADELADKYGDRFRPTQYLRDMAAKGESFPA